MADKEYLTDEEVFGAPSSEPEYLTDEEVFGTVEEPKAKKPKMQDRMVMTEAPPEPKREPVTLDDFAQEGIRQHKEQQAKEKQAFEESNNRLSLNGVDFERDDKGVIHLAGKVGEPWARSKAQYEAVKAKFPEFKPWVAFEDRPFLDRLFPGSNPGMLSKEEQAAEVQGRQEWADQAALTEKLKQEAERQLRADNPNPYDGATFAGTDIPMTTPGERNAAELEAKAKGPAPTQKVWRDFTERSAEAFINGLVSMPRGAAEGADAVRYFATARADDLQNLNRDRQLDNTFERSKFAKTMNKVSDEVRKAFPGDKTRADEFIAQLGQGGGSMLSFMVGGAAVRSLGIPSKIGTMATGAGVGGVGGMEDAEQHGADTAAKYLSFLLNAGIGTSEAIPIDRALHRLNMASGGKVADIISSGAVSSLEEMLQEVGQQIGGNEVAKVLYDNKRDIFEGVGDSAKVAGVLGFLTGGGFTAAKHIAGGEDAAQPAPPPPAPEPELAPDEPSAEPLIDVKGQLADLHAKDSKRMGVYLPKEGAEHAAEVLKDAKGVRLENFDGKGGVVIARTNKIAKEVLKAREAGVPMQAILGKITGAGEGKPADGKFVVQQLNKDGAVVRESLVNEQQLGETEKAFQRDGHTVKTVSVEDAVKRRDEWIAHDKGGPPPVGQAPRAPQVPREFPGAILTDHDIFGEAAPDAPASMQVSTQASDAQKAAGNYKKGHVKLQGLDITIENPKGSERTGKAADGTEWSVTMPAAYGYVKRTKGADGDQVDVFLGPKADTADKVFVIDQVDPETGNFDEHKAVMGVDSADEAAQLYHQSFSDGRGGDRIANMVEMSVEEFKTWARSGNTTKPLWGNRMLPPAKFQNPARPAEAEAGAASPGKSAPPAPGTAKAAPRPSKAKETPQPEAAEKSHGQPVSAPLETARGIARRDVGDDEAITSSGRRVPVTYAVVEAADLVPSQGDDGQTNAAYPSELQPRDRERRISATQVHDIASRLEPKLLDKSPKASDGAPIIAADGVVESGNGRVLAIRRAYDRKMPGGEKYREHLKAQGYPVDGMEKPVLVRVRKGELGADERQTFTREANERDTLAMSAPERAMADAAQLSDAVLSLYRGGDLDEAGNREFTKAFLRDVVAKNDQGNLVDEGGRISQEAVRRMGAALLAKAYGDADLISALTESTDINIKGIGNALLDVAGTWAQMRGEATDGKISKEVDQTKALLEAVRLVDRSRREGKPLALLVGQNDIFSGTGISVETELFLALMFRDTENWKQPVSRRSLSDALTFFVTEARKTFDGTDLLGETAPPARDILVTARRKQTYDYEGDEADQGQLQLAKPQRAVEEDGAGDGKDAGAPGEGGEVRAEDGSGARDEDQGQVEVPVGGGKDGEVNPESRPAEQHKGAPPFDPKAEVEVSGIVQEPARKKPSKAQPPKKAAKDQGQVIENPPPGSAKPAADSKEPEAGSGEPDWWKDLTAAGRAPIIARVSSTLSPKVTWNNLSSDNRKKAQAAYEAMQKAEAKPSDYGAKNKLVSADRAAELRAKLQAKLKGQLNAGIDPEMLAMGAELAAFHIEAGARKFADFARAVANDLGSTVEKLRPYLRSWYNGARDMMEDNGLDVGGMDDAETVKAELRKLFEAEAKTPEKPDNSMLGLKGPISGATDLFGAPVEEKPKKAKSIKVAWGEQKLLDFGSQSIDGYDEYSEGAGARKARFLTDAESYLKKVAQALEERGFTRGKDKKGKPRKSVTTNEGGIAVSGDVYLEMDGPDGLGVQAQITQSALQPGTSVIVRTKTASGTLGMNNWWSPDLTVDELAAKIDRLVGAESGRLTFDLPQEQNAPDERADPASGELGAGGEPEAQPGVADGQQGGDRPAGTVAEPAASNDGGTRGTAGERGGAGARSDGSQAQGAGTVRGERPADPGRGTASSSGVADAGAGDGEQPSNVRPNYHLTDPERLVGGGPKARFAKNRKAIETYHAVADAGREPTADELDAIAAYIGWGSFGQELFNGSWDRPQPKDGWQEEDQWLREHLGEEQWKGAQTSIINAHYTDPPTVTAMWDIVRKLGFTGGRVLEPSMGIGNFFALMPRDLMGRSDLTGIEMDKLTGGMAKVLYPRANVQIKGYQDSKTPDGFYDLVIGNWPFSPNSPADRRYDKLNASLHDYFFIKALDQVRPGGFVIGITSAGTMDKIGRVQRLNMASKAELVAAFRLPSGAFEKYAGTAVVTDLLIFQRREKGRPADAPPEEWIDTGKMDTDAGETITVNNYWLAHPENVLGHMTYGSGTTYGRAAMIVNRKPDFPEKLADLPNRVPEGIYVPPNRPPVRYIVNNTLDRQGHVIEKDGKLYVVQGEHLGALEDLLKYKVKDPAKTANREAQISKVIAIRKALGAVMDAERDGLANVETLRKTLKNLYDRFVQSHGKLAKSDALNILQKANDPSATMLRALEKPNGEPALIFTQATVRQKRNMENPSVRDAFVAVRNESVHINLDRVAELAKVSKEQVTQELLASGAILRTPGNGYEIADQYLSGNVRLKLREAEAALANGEDMQASVDALKQVIPRDIPYYQIEAKLGAPWVSNETYQRFIEDLLGLSDVSKIVVRLKAGYWKVSFKDAGYNDRNEATTRWGHSAINFDKLLTRAMGNQSIRIFTKDQDGNRILDTTATAEANNKAMLVREEFQTWAWRDAERKVALEKQYNEQLNAVATPRYDGSFLEFTGMSLTRGEDQFSLRQHQVNAIYRGLVNQRGIFAHEVGTGKTYTMAGIAIESRKYGLAQKPLLLAHNANSASVAREAQEMYPGAKVMYVDNASGEDIGTTLQRIATDDWDLIVVPHSLIDRFALSAQTLSGLAAEEISALEEEALEAIKEDTGADFALADLDDEKKMAGVRSQTAKQLVRQRQAIIDNIAKMAARASRENAIMFEDLGIDMVIVDEAHEFKKPPIATRMQLKGLNKDTSNRSIALQFLTHYVKQLRGGKGVMFFTGTPITNTLTEIFKAMRYVMDDQMQLAGVKDWDTWFNTFADSSSDVELTATGDYEPVTRLSQFVNVAELRRLIGQFTDIVFADDMPEFKPRATESGKTLASKDLTDEERAFLANGRSKNPIGRPYKKVVVDVGPMGPEQEAELQRQIELATQFKNAGGKQRRDWLMKGDERVPIRTETAIANASLDVRLALDAQAEDHPESKANRALRRIMEHYKEDPRATQVIFMERGFSSFTMKSGGKNEDGSKRPGIKVERFNLVQDIIAKLVKAGVPREEIAVVDGSVSKEKRKEIADAMNEAKIRVVIGSTDTLGVGVNMQRHLRAMHHLDAPWMPGELIQRNGRGERQGNEWNTVLEYRYITDKLDGRRWQVLAIKDRFIRAFLTAAEDVRVIEGEAVSEDEADDADGLAKTLSEAAGDPRLFRINKYRADVERLERRERMHTYGIAEAKGRIREVKENIERLTRNAARMERDAAKYAEIRKAETFTAEISGVTYTDRKEANEALAKKIAGMAQTVGTEETVATVQGFPIEARVGMTSVSLTITGNGDYGTGNATIASIEGTLRNIAPNRDHMLERIAEETASVPRLEEMLTQPFAQQAQLDKARRLFEETNADLVMNPVPPPSWLRHGAPAGTRIYFDGLPVDVEGHRYTSEGYFVVTAQGDIPYLEAKDEQGNLIYEPHTFTPPVEKPWLDKLSARALKEGFKTQIDEKGTWHVLTPGFATASTGPTEVLAIRAFNMSPTFRDYQNKPDANQPAQGSSPVMGSTVEQDRARRAASPLRTMLDKVAQGFGYKIVDTGLPFGFTDRWGKFHSFGTQIIDKAFPGSDVGKWMDSGWKAIPGLRDYIRENMTAPWAHRVWFGHDPLANLSAVIDKFGVSALPDYAVQLFKDSLTKAGIPLPGVQWLVHAGLVSDRAATAWLSLNIGEALSGGLSILGTYRLMKQVKNGQPVERGWAALGILFKVVGGTLSANPVVLMSAATDMVLLARARPATARAALEKVEKQARRIERKGGPTIYGNTDESAPTFYSALVRAVDGIRMGRAPAAQWLATLKNQPGVKQEEMDWIGLGDWLNAQQGHVTKEAVQAFVRANQVEVRETLKGEIDPKAEQRLIDEYTKFLDANNLPSMSADELVLEDDLTATQRAWLADFSRRWDEVFGPQGANAPRYNQYQLPGGKNYRELLLTLPTPPDMSVDTTGWKVVETPGNFAGNFAVMNAQGEVVRYWEDGLSDEDMIEQTAEDFAKANRPENWFKSGHWSEPNVLAHVRFNEREADGKRVLFIEEIQSDWHQKGRKQGYRDEELIARLKKERDAIKAAGGDYGAINVRLSDLHASESAVPDAPFKTTWPELALKRMIRWAAENGFDSIAWTPGDVQAERYNLSRVLDGVNWTTRPQVGKYIAAAVKGSGFGSVTTNVNGKIVIAKGSLDSFEGKNLDEVFGKDLAEKIMNEETGELEGEGLRIGGQGMKAFYDKMLVDAANKLGKKFGAKASRMGIIPRFGDSRGVIVRRRGDTWQLYDADNSVVVEDGLTWEAAVAKADKANADAANGVQAHILPITPEMRRSVMEGMPLFEARQNPAPRIRATPAQLRAATIEVRRLTGRMLGRKISAYVAEDMPDYISRDFIAAFDPHTRTIFITMRAASELAKNVGHETLHALRRLGVITDSEWSALVAAAKKGGYQPTAKSLEVYRREYVERWGMSEAAFKDMLDEEAVARLMGDFVAARENTSTAVQRIIDKLREWADAVLKAVGAAGVEVEARDFLRSAYAGDVARREASDYPELAPVMGNMADGTPDPKGMAIDGEGEEELEQLAGNINLRRLNAPDDIKTMLKDVATEASGFMGERRGVISNEQTAALAAELGLSVKELLARPTGAAFNAEQIFAARSMLLKSAERVKKLAARAKTSTSMTDLAEFQKAVLRHRAIQEQIAGITAEAGRALQQFNMIAGKDYIRGLDAIIGGVKNSKATFDAKRKGEEDVTRELADMIDALSDPAQIGKFIADSRKATWGDMIREVWINSLLSGPRTHAANIVSNTLTALWQVPETAVAAALGSLHGGEKVAIGEASARLFGLVQGARDGLEAAGHMLKTGEPRDAISKLEAHERRAVPGKVGEAVRIPGRLLEAEDQFFKAMAYRAEINALAHRQATFEGRKGQDFQNRIKELVTNPSQKMQHQAHQAALYQTFQNKLGPKGQWVMNLREAIPGAWLVLPFIRTPANILKYAAERTPLGLAMKPVRDNLTGKNGNVARDVQAARMLMGTAIMASVVMMVGAGLVTGGAPDDPDEERILRATGWQPYSIKVGDTYVSYQRLDPIALIVGIAADSVGIWEHVTQAEGDKVAAMLVTAIANNIKEKTWISGLVTFNEAFFSGDAWKLNAWANRLASSVVPQAVAQYTQSQDPFVREARSMLDAIKARVPGYSSTLVAKRNVFGEQIKREGAVGPDILSPFFVSTVKDNPVAQEMLRVGYFPSMPNRVLAGHKLTAEQYDRFVEVSGKRATARLNRLISSSRWNSKSDTDKQDTIRDEFTAARKVARDELRKLWPELRKKVEE